MQRETQTTTTLQGWKGINQRAQPTLVSDGYFTSARGVFFGLENAAERLPGKTLSSLITQPIFGLAVIGDNVVIQGLTTEWIISIADLLAGDF